MLSFRAWGLVTFVCFLLLAVCVPLTICQGLFSLRVFGGGDVVNVKLVHFICQKQLLICS